MKFEDQGLFADMIQQGLYSSAPSLASSFTGAAEGIINPIDQSRQKDIGLIVSGIAADMKTAM